MNKQALERYKKQLRELVERVRGTTNALEEQVRTPSGGEAGGGISNAPLHLGDLGTATYAHELSATLLENESYIRDEALAALERIDRGTYGRCARCGEPIPEERLDALPYTRYCTACAEQVQDAPAVNLNTGRPTGWLGEPGHEGANQTGAPRRVPGRDLGAAADDVHASGTPGGGSASGGLAGTNVGEGDTDHPKLEAALGSGRADAPDDTEGEDQPDALAGSAGGAIGGTPANKRSKAHSNPPKASKAPKARGKKPPAKKKTRAKRAPE